MHARVHTSQPTVCLCCVKLGMLLYRADGLYVTALLLFATCLLMLVALQRCLPVPLDTNRQNTSLLYPFILHTQYNHSVSW
jgi:hypothetical protein